MEKVMNSQQHLHNSLCEVNPRDEFVVQILFYVYKPCQCDAY